MNSHLDRVTDWALMASQARYRAKDLADLMQVSLRQLERYFGDSFQRTPQEWLDEMRLVKAALLLTHGTLVKEAAWQLGFRGVPHFSRRFKGYHGCSPSEFIRIHDRRKAERLKQFEAWFPGEPIPPVWLLDPSLVKPWELLLQPTRYWGTASAKNTYRSILPIPASTPVARQKRRSCLPKRHNSGEKSE